MQIAQKWGSGRQNTKWNNVTSVQCWQRLMSLATSAGKVAKNYCGFVVVAGENAADARRTNPLCAWCN